MATASFSTPIREYLLGKNYTIQLFDEGLVIHQRRKTTPIVWEEIEALVWRYQKSVEQFDLRLHDTRVIKFIRQPVVDPWWKNGHAELRYEIERQLVLRHLPDLLTRLGRGETLTFGPIHVGPSGLETKSGHLDWRDFSTMAFDFPDRGNSPKSKAVQFCQHAQPYIWQAFAWDDIPNLAVLFNLLEEITDQRLWVHGWKIDQSKTHPAGSGLNLRFSTEMGQTLSHRPRLGLRLWDLFVFSIMLFVVAVPVLYVVKPGSVEGFTSSWLLCTVVILPFGLIFLRHRHREARVLFEIAATDVALTPNGLTIKTKGGHDFNRTWRDLMFVEGQLYFDGKVWLFGCYKDIFVLSIDGFSGDDEYLVDPYLNPAIKMWAEKTAIRAYIANRIAYIEQGHEVELESFQRIYLLNNQGLRSADDKVTWSDLRAKATPYNIQLPEWAWLERYGVCASEFYAVIRHYIYESK